MLNASDMSVSRPPEVLLEERHLSDMANLRRNC